MVLLQGQFVNELEHNVVPYGVNEGTLGLLDRFPDTVETKTDALFSLEHTTFWGPKLRVHPRVKQCESEAYYLQKTMFSCSETS